MNAFTTLGATAARLLGFDHGGDRYTYVDDPVLGPVSADRAANRWVRTTCGYCSVGCGMLIGVRDGRAVAVAGDPDHPVNRGRLCPKGLSEHQMIHADGRLTAPIVDGAETDWDTALDRVVGGFRDLIERHGPESVAIISTGQLVTEEFYTLGKLARIGMGLRHVDGNTTLCMASAVAGYKQSFGADGPPGSYEDFELADVVVLWARTSLTTTRCSLRVLGGDRSGRHVVVVDPRVTKTAMIADTHIPVRPRGDVALLNGILRVLVDDGRIDLADAARRIDGIADLAVHLDTWTVERAAAESGIEEAAVVALARRIGAARALRDRLDDGREPLGAGHPDGHPAQHTRRPHRQHRSARRGAVLDHRAMQRDGHPRGGLHGVDARLPELRGP